MKTFLSHRFVLLALLLCAVSASAQTSYTLSSDGRSTVDLCADRWKFTRSNPPHAEQADFADAAWETVTLPHTWNALDGQDGGNNYYRGIGWYRRHLNLSPINPQGKRVYLQFDGANLVTNVYLNGKPVGEHRGGHGGFIYDITPLLKPGGDNVLAVKVNNAYNREIAPLEGDWTMCGGIYRAVRLLVLEPVHISPLDYDSPGVYLLPTDVSANSAKLQVRTLVRNDGAAQADVTVKVSVMEAGGKLVQTTSFRKTDVPAGKDETIRQDLTIPRPHLWNGRLDPYLYQVRVELEQGGILKDAVTQPLGFRFYHVDKEKGFILNGQPYDLHGTALHEMRLDKGNAISDADRREDIGLLMELGATFVRFSHYQYAPAMYRFADEKGLVVWSEVPFVNSATATPAFRDNLIEQLRELIRQNYNHPCVCVWGIQNEIHGDPKERDVLVALNEAAHQEDPSRPTGEASHLSGKTIIDFVADLQAFNKYFGWYGGKADQFAGFADGMYAGGAVAKPMGVTEYGAGGSIGTHTDDPGTFDPSGKPPGNGPVGEYHPEEYQAAFHETHWRAMRERPWLWVKTIWNLADFAADARPDGDTLGRNDKGLVTMDRKTRKDAFFYYKANWTEAPFVYIASRRFTPRTKPETTVKVYSTCDAVELSLNGQPKGKMAGAPDHVFTLSVTLKEGTNTVSVKGTKNGGGAPCEDSIQWQVQTGVSAPPAPAR